MPTRVYWDDPDYRTTIRLDYVGSWTWSEVFQAADEMRALARTADHRVDLIIDLTHGTTPNIGSSFANNRRVLRHMPPNAGMVVMLVDRVEAVLMNMLINFDGRFATPIVSARTLQQARQIIRQARQTREAPTD